MSLATLATDILSVCLSALAVLAAGASYRVASQTAKLARATAIEVRGLWPTYVDEAGEVQIGDHVTITVINNGSAPEYLEELVLEGVVDEWARRPQHVLLTGMREEIPPRDSVTHEVDGRGWRGAFPTLRFTARLRSGQYVSSDFYNYPEAAFKKKKGPL